jgi:tripartite-type tricarboxylate transporter receptor subunit TctC
MKKVIAALLLLFSVLSFAAPAIEIIVPYSSGGPSDLVARAAQRYFMSGAQPTPVVIINKPGADGIIGTSIAARRPADGTSLLLAAAGPMVFNRVLYKNLEYDYTDFDIIAPIAKTPTAIVVSGKSKISNFKEFVESAKQNRINCGVSNTTGVFASRELISKLSLVSIEVIPFKGGNDNLISLLGGHTDCAIDAMSNFITPYTTGDVRIIAVASNIKYPQYGNPALIKDTIPGFIFTSWFGLGVLTNTPTVRKNAIMATVSELHKDPEFKKIMATVGLEVSDAAQTITESKKYIAREYEYYDSIRVRLNIDKVDR